MPKTPMLYFLFDLLDVWTNMLCTQILCSFNVHSNFEYVPITNYKHVFLGGLDNIPNFIPRTELYPNLDLELVLVRDTTELTILNDLVKLLSNHVKYLSLFTLDGTFSALGD
jgi:hypothetical protein